MIRRLCAVASLWLAATFAAASAAPPPERIYVNARVWTADAAQPAAAQQGGQCAADHSEGQQTDDAVCVLHDLLQNLFLRNTAFSHFIREKAF